MLWVLLLVLVLLISEIAMIIWCKVVLQWHFCTWGNGQIWIFPLCVTEKIHSYELPPDLLFGRHFFKMELLTEIDVSTNSAPCDGDHTAGTLELFVFRKPPMLQSCFSKSSLCAAMWCCRCGHCFAWFREMFLRSNNGAEQCSKITISVFPCLLRWSA